MLANDLRPLQGRGNRAPTSDLYNTMHVIWHDGIIINVNIGKMDGDFIPISIYNLTNPG